MGKEGCSTTFVRNAGMRQMWNYFQLVYMNLKVDALGHIQMMTHLYVPDALLPTTQTKVLITNSDSKK
jgi:hypothetical protein